MLEPIRTQNLGSLLMKLSQSNFNLRSPDCCLVRSYLIATVGRDRTKTKSLQQPGVNSLFVEQAKPRIFFSTSLATKSMRMKPIYQLFMGAFNKTAKISHHGVILKSILFFIKSRYCEKAKHFLYYLVMLKLSGRFFQNSCGLLRISEHYNCVSPEISSILYELFINISLQGREQKTKIHLQKG
jgi:hypothetical protein